MQLARIMALNLLNLYALIFALFDKITAMNNTLGFLKKEINATMHKTFTVIDKTHNYPPMEMRDAGPTRPTLYEMVTSTLGTAFSELTSTDTSFAFEYGSSTTDLLSTTLAFNNTQCHQIEVSCPQPNSINRTTLVTSFILLNLLSTSQTFTTELPLYDSSDISLNNSSTEIDFTTLAFDGENTTNVTLENSFEDTWKSTTAIPFNYTDQRNHSRQRRSDYNDYYYDSESSELLTNDDELSTDSKDEDTAVTATEYTTEYSTTDDNFPSTVSSIFSTMSTYLEEITSEMSFDNRTEYLDFAQTTLMAFLTTEYPDSSVENETCYDTICEDVSDLTTQYDWDTSSVTANSEFDMSNTEMRSPSESTTEITTNFQDNPSTAIDEFTTMDFTDYSTTLNSFESTTTPETFHSTESTMKSRKIIHETDQDLEKFIGHMNSSDQLVLRKLCWETMFGQELVKLTVMDLVVTITSALFMDFFRALFVRFFNRFWCWNLEKRFPKVRQLFTCIY